MTVNPGNSGGPIFNKNGQIVGATGKLNKTQILEEDGFIPEDISFGVTSQRALEFMNRPNCNGSEPYQYSTEQLYKYMRSAISLVSRFLAFGCTLISLSANAEWFNAEGRHPYSRSVSVLFLSSLSCKKRRDE